MFKIKMVNYVTLEIYEQFGYTTVEEAVADLPNKIKAWGVNSEDCEILVMTMTEEECAYFSKK